MRLPQRSMVLMLGVLAATVGGGCGEAPQERTSAAAPSSEAPKPAVVPTEPEKLPPPPTEPAPRPVLKLPAVRLPMASFARPVEKPAGELTISLTPAGLALGDRAVKSTAELKRLLTAQIEEDAALRTQAPVLRADGDMAVGKVIGLLRLCQALGFRDATLRVMRKSGVDSSEGEIPVHLESYGILTYGRRSNSAKPRTTPDEEAAMVDGVLVDIKAAEEKRTGTKDGEIDTLVVIDARGGGFACSTLENLKKYLDILKEDITPSKETLRIAADPKLKYGIFLEVMELCQKLGFGRIVLHEPKAGDPADAFE